MIWIDPSSLPSEISEGETLTFSGTACPHAGVYVVLSGVLSAGTPFEYEYGLIEGGFVADESGNWTFGQVVPDDEPDDGWEGYGRDELTLSASVWNGGCTSEGCDWQEVTVQRFIIINNVPPTVTTDPFEKPFYKEGEIITVRGTIGDVELDAHTVKVKIDFTGDGDYDDDLDEVGTVYAEIDGSFSYGFVARDDGPIPGNGSASDSLAITVEQGISPINGTSGT